MRLCNSPGCVGKTYSRAPFLSPCDFCGLSDFGPEIEDDGLDPNGPAFEGQADYATQNDEVDHDPEPFVGPAAEDTAGARRADDADVFRANRQNDITRDELDCLEGFTISIVGFATAGKTWYLNRLKHLYTHGDDDLNVEDDLYTCLPPYVAPGKSNEVERSDFVTAHNFAKRGDPHRSFNILDIPGERLERAAENHFINAGAVLDSIKRSDALIFMLPMADTLFAHRLADDTLQPGPESDEDRSKVVARTCQRLLAQEAELADARAILDRLAQPRRGKAAERRKAQERVDELQAAAAATREEYFRISERQLAQAKTHLGNFIGSIGRLVAVMSALRNGKTETEVHQMRGQDLQNLIKDPSFRRHPTPAVFVLSKVDDLLDPKPFLREKLREGQHVVSDLARRGVSPLHAVRTYNRGLANHAAEYFEWCTFLSATAFWGHDGVSDFSYSKTKPYGVTQVIDWLLWARGITGRPPKASGVGAGAPSLSGNIDRWAGSFARWARRRIDAEKSGSAR